MSMPTDHWPEPRQPAQPRSEACTPPVSVNQLFLAGWRLLGPAAPAPGDDGQLLGGHGQMLSDGGKADVAALRKSNCVRPARHSRRITAGGAAWRSFRRPSRATAAISTVDGVRGPCTGCRGRRTAGTGAPLPPPGLTTAAATPVPAELPRWGRLRRVRRPRWAVSGDGLLHMADEVNDHGVEWAALLARVRTRWGGMPARSGHPGAGLRDRKCNAKKLSFFLQSLIAF